MYREQVLNEQIQMVSSVKADRDQQLQAAEASAAQRIEKVEITAQQKIKASNDLNAHAVQQRDEEIQKLQKSDRSRREHIQ